MYNSILLLFSSLTVKGDRKKVPVVHLTAHREKNRTKCLSKWYPGVICLQYGHVLCLYSLNSAQFHKVSVFCENLLLLSIYRLYRQFL